MKRKSVFKFACEHCNRISDVESVILDHEQRCIRNPERVCGMCREAGLQQVERFDLLTALANRGLDGLRDAAHGCPACVLSTILQWGVLHPTVPLPWLPFDYSAEVKAFRQRRAAVA